MQLIVLSLEFKVIETNDDLNNPATGCSGQYFQTFLFKKD